jgi:hypothetical protein
MNVKYSQDPKVWRKSTLLTALALTILCTFLRWRHFLPTGVWGAALASMVCVATLAWFRPQYFQIYYRFSTWAGFWSSQWVARVALAAIFVGIIAPAGIVLRLLGKDPLRLKRSGQTTSYWRPAKQGGSLDRLF